MGQRQGDVLCFHVPSERSPPVVHCSFGDIIQGWLKETTLRCDAPDVTAELNGWVNEFFSEHCCLEAAGHSSLATQKWSTLQLNWIGKSCEMWNVMTSLMTTWFFPATQVASSAFSNSQNVQFPFKQSSDQCSQCWMNFSHVSINQSHKLLKWWLHNHDFQKCHWKEWHGTF